MIARSGSQQMAPMIPVKVIRPRGLAADRGDGSSRGVATTSACEGTGIMEDSAASRKRAIVTYAHPRTQGSDRPAAGAARGVSVFQRGGRDHLRRQGEGLARPRT